MIEQLKQYPTAIASVEEKLLKLSLEIEIQTEVLSFLDADIEKAIASDSQLKNDQTRKAKRLELQQQPDYLEAKAHLKKAKEDRDRASIAFHQLRGGIFSAEARTENADRIPRGSRLNPKTQATADIRPKI